MVLRANDDMPTSERTGHDVAVGLLHPSDPVGVGARPSDTTSSHGRLAMRTLSVVTKLTVEALERGERGEGLAAEPDPAGRRPSPAMARSRVLLPSVAAYERRDRLRGDGVGVAQQDAAAVGEGEAAQQDAWPRVRGPDVHRGGMEGRLPF